MHPKTVTRTTLSGWIAVFLLMMPAIGFGQAPPYDVFPAAEPPYYRVRYEASAGPDELVFPVSYTVWIPPGVESLRGVVVHQHGCGEGSCKSGLTGAFDLHWQALARAHDCALLAPSYEQPADAECRMWCDPRNGSDARFRQCLVDLGKEAGHPELSEVPWALWGHSGGGHWAGAMLLLHPHRVAAAWLRSGVPPLEPNPDRPASKPYSVPEAALEIPIICNLGTKEGVTVKEGRFARVWPANQAFFKQMRSQGSLIGIAVDPLTSHECGNQRYLAIPWLDTCLTARLPRNNGGPLRPMPTDEPWLAPVPHGEATPVASFAGDRLKASWLPNQAIAKKWMQYVTDTAVTDPSPPPAPHAVMAVGNQLTWSAAADLESGLAGFIIERDGELLARVPEQAENRFGRPLFQNLQYSDTPTQPLVPLRYTDTSAESGQNHRYQVIAVNTVGLQSAATTAQSGQSADARAEREPHRDQLAAELATYMDATHKVKDFSGSVCIATDEQTLLCRGYGLANREHAVANTPSTKFRIGSITKQFTAMAIMLLDDRGKLQVDDSISAHISDAPAAWDDVTIHHLLTHTSGIPSFTGMPEYPRKMMLPQTTAEMMGRFSDARLEFIPGKKFAYSNSGYFLLGVIVESASGVTYENFLREAIFTPLKMTSTGYDRYGTILPNRAAGYSRHGGVAVNARYLDMSQPYAAGALYSTVEDLRRWDAALREGRLLSAAGYEKMWTPAKASYAYGWRVVERNGQLRMSHGGGINGFRSYFLRVPTARLSVSVLCNVDYSDPAVIANDLAKIALGLGSTGEDP